MGNGFLVNIGVLAVTLWGMRSGYTAEIRVMHDADVSNSSITWLLSLLNADRQNGNCSASCGNPDVDVTSIQDRNTFKISQSVYRYPVILVIPCLLCRSTLSSLPGNVTLLCTEGSTDYKLVTCSTSLLVRDLWTTLISDLSVKGAVVFYNPLTTESLVDIGNAFQSSYSIVWNGDNLHHVKIVGSTYRNFIISTSLNQTYDILIQSRQLNLLGPEFNWLVDMREESEAIHQRLPLLVNDGDNTAIVVLNEDFMTQQTLEVNHVVNRLLSDKQQQEANDLQRQEVPILDIYKCTGACKSKGMLSRVSSVTRDGCIGNRKKIFPERFGGFEQRILRVVTKVYEPFVILDKYPNGTKVYRGVCIEMLKALADILDFRYDIFEVADGKFGVTNASGQWNGLIGVMARGEADLIVSALTVSSDRDQVVDYMFPFWEEPSTVLLKKSKDKSKMTSVFRPFKPSTWYGIVASVFATSGVIYVMCFLSRRLLGVQEPLNTAAGCVWYTCGALLGQGTERQPLSLSSRVVASCWWIVVIVLYAVYTGNLIAFLTVNIPYMPFNTLEEMVKQSEYLFGLEDGIIHMMLFREAESGVYKDIWKGIQKHYSSVIVETSEIALKKVETEKFAFIGEKTFLQARSRNKCDLVMIDEEFFKSSFAFAVREGWPYKKYFDEAIMSMVEAGFIEHWRSVHFRSSRCESNGAAVKLRPTQLADTSGLYMVLLSGGVVAVLTLVAESIVRLIRNRSSQRISTHGRRIGRGAPGANTVATRASNRSGQSSANGDAVLRYARDSTPAMKNANGFDSGHLPPASRSNDLPSDSGNIEILVG